MPSFRLNYGVASEHGSSAYIHYDELKGIIQKLGSLKGIEKNESLGSIKNVSLSAKVYVADIEDNNLKSGSISQKGSQKLSMEDQYSLLNSGFHRLFEIEVARVCNFISEQILELDIKLALEEERMNTEGVIEKLRQSYIESKTQRGNNFYAGHKETIIRLEREIRKVENIRCINCLGIIKILKKYDKLHQSISTDQDKKNDDGSNTVTTDLYPTLYESNENCIKLENDLRKGLEEMTARLTKVFSVFVTGKDTREASLRINHAKTTYGSSKETSAGIAVGVVIGVFAWFLWDVVIPGDYGDYSNLFRDPALYLYAFVGNVLVYRALWSVLLFVWDHAHINYTYLLDIRDQHSPEYLKTFFKFAIETIFFITNMIFYVFARRGGKDSKAIGGLYFLSFLPAEVFPISLFTVVVGLKVKEAFDHLINKKASHAVFTPEILFALFTSPFSSTALKYGFAGDFLTSMGRVFNNGARSICYLASGAVAKDPIAAGYSLSEYGVCTDSRALDILGTFFFVVPLWIKYLHCCHNVYVHCPKGKLYMWPHSYNAFKYILSLLVSVIGLFHPLKADSSMGKKIILFLGFSFASLYSWLWDVHCDWGLLQDLDSKSSNFLLRKQLIYREHKPWYYVAMLANLVMRILWMLSLVPRPASEGDGSRVRISDILYPFFAVIEQVRRIIWGIFKLECEHIKAAQAAQKEALQSTKMNLHEHSDIIPYDLEIYKNDASAKKELSENDMTKASHGKELTTYQRLQEEGNLVAGTLHVIGCLVIVIGTYFAFHFTSE